MESDSLVMRVLASSLPACLPFASSLSYFLLSSLPSFLLVFNRIHTPGPAVSTYICQKLRLPRKVLFPYALLSNEEAVQLCEKTWAQDEIMHRIGIHKY